VLLRFRLDEGTREWAADLLVGDHHDRDWEMRAPARCVQMRECGERDRVAALHVVDAGAVRAIALDTHRQRARERADGVHRVHVPEQENAGAVRGARHAPDQDVADAALAGNALDARADRAQQAFRVSCNSIDGLRILRRALDIDPGIDGSEQGFRREVAHGAEAFG